MPGLQNGSFGAGWVGAELDLCLWGPNARASRPRSWTKDEDDCSGLLMGVLTEEPASGLR